jgi:hypothetical protein
LQSIWQRFGCTEDLSLLTKSEFEYLFYRALAEAAHLAEEQLGRLVPRVFMICLHGEGHRGDVVVPKVAAEVLYLGEDLFSRIIDVSVVEVSPGVTTVFVRPSDQSPSSLDRTLNSPPGSGPFKQLGPRVPIRVALG